MKNLFLVLLYCILFTSTGWGQGVGILASPSGSVFSKGTNGSVNSILSGLTPANNFGWVGVSNDMGVSTGSLFLNAATKNGLFLVEDNNGNPNVALGALANNEDSGLIAVHDGNGNSKDDIGITSRGNGFLEIFGSNNSINVLGTDAFNRDSMGFLGAYDAAGNRQSYMHIFSFGMGAFTTRGPNSFNVGFTVLVNQIIYENNGFIAIGDTTTEAGIVVGELDGGVIFADSKSFRMQHPTQREKDIWYTGIEGPEAAAYARGTAYLQDGAATIKLPEHFLQVASDEGVTVILAPLSAESKGLAATEKNVKEGIIKVQELFRGQGNYAFSWEVKAVRKSYENYKVIRDKGYARPAFIELDVPQEIGRSKSAIDLPQLGEN